MPWESRIHSESTRRHVITAIMLALLAASTGLAVLISSRAGNRSKLSMTPQDFHWFQVTVPGRWERFEPEAPDNTDGLEPLAAFDEGPPMNRRLSLYALDQPRPAIPVQVLADLGNEFDPTSLAIRLLGPWDVRNEHICAVADQTLSGSGQGFDDAPIQGLATLDGRRFLLVRIEGADAASPRDRDLMGFILNSVEDLTFSPASDVLDLGGVAQVDVPRSWRAFSRSSEVEGGNPSFILAPASHDAFIRLYLTTMSLDDAIMPSAHGLSADAGSNGSIGDMMALGPQLLERMKPENLEHSGDRLQVALLLHYLAQHGPLPTGVRPEAVADLPMAGFVLTGGTQRRAGTYRLCWALDCGQQHVLLVDLIADWRASSEAVAAAHQVLKKLQSMSSASTSAIPYLKQGSGQD